MVLMMTPQEIFEYKMRWSPGYSVPIHSDLDWKAKDWCRKNMDRHRWSMDTWTNNYEHTFRFERKHDADLFASTFNEWVNPNQLDT